MSDTHIHIHMGGESPPAVTKAASRPKVKVNSSSSKSKAPRKVGAYQKRYGKHFKRLQAANKKKDGSWKKGGFKKTQKAAHKAAKK
tara:strand:+ start:1381 stop:1638 length:258 start_codon:yes stop_codon:yes gene_type:complete